MSGRFKTLMVVFLFLVLGGAVYPLTLKGVKEHRDTHAEEQRDIPARNSQILFSNYRGYVFGHPNTTLWLKFIFAWYNSRGEGIGLALRGLESSINWSIVPGENLHFHDLKLHGQVFYVRLNFKKPGFYNLSKGYLILSTANNTLSASIGDVVVEISDETYPFLKWYAYPSAGSIWIHPPNSTITYWTVLKNYGNESIRILNVSFGAGIMVKNLYYQDVPQNVSPQKLDIPNLNLAKEWPKKGLMLPPQNAVAIITTLQPLGSSAILSPKIMVQIGNRTYPVPGTPYYLDAFPGEKELLNLLKKGS